MNTINDSDSFLNNDRLLSQHQAALSIIQGKTDNPLLTSYKWLDLCCGKGQIIINLEENLSKAARNKIEFFAYDVKEDFLKITLKKAESLGFRAVHGQVGDIEDFSKLYSTDHRFDFITSINTIHEIPPLSIPEIIFESIIRLNNYGSLLIYDMENLPALELGAITWSCEEMAEIVKSFLSHLGIDRRYNAMPGKWKQHSSCNLWNIHLQKEYFGVDNEQLLNRKEKTIAAAQATILYIVGKKLDKCRGTLESITKYGAENTDEYKTKEKLLYDFWALKRLRKQ